MRGLVALILSATAVATASSFDVSHDARAAYDGGWISNHTSFKCVSGCSGVQGVYIEVRPDPGGYGSAGSFDAGLGLYQATGFPFVHLSHYAYRLSAVRGDGGHDVPGPEVPVIADMAGASVHMGLPVVTWQDGGTVAVSWTPAVDDGGGVGDYRLSATLAMDPVHQTTGLFTGTVPSVVVTVGPGDWELSLNGSDTVGNDLGGTGFVAPFSVFASPAIPVPTPPVPTAALFSSANISLFAPDSGDEWHYRGVRADGGLFAAPIETFVTGSRTTVSGYLSEECAFRLQASVAVNGDVSDWSAPSSVFVVDLKPPTAPSPVRLSLDGGAVRLEWPASVDGCSGVAGYDVDRRFDGGAWAPLVRSGEETALDDVPGAPGWEYRVVARDHAGHASDAGLAADPTLASSDGGSGSSAPLRVGCDCDAAGGMSLGALLATAALVRGRRRAA